MAGLPTPIVRASVSALARVALRPSVPVARTRSLIEAAFSLPLPPKGTSITAIELGGVACEQVIAPGASDTTRAIFYLHGGGYVVCSPRVYRLLTAALSAAFGARVIVLDYRLAPEHPYPAQFDDAVAAWRALVSSGGSSAGASGGPLDSGRVAVAGDSAGAGLALGLTLRLRAAGEPLPGALGLICPWLDPRADLEQTRAPVAGDVLLSQELMTRWASAFLGSGGSAVLDTDPELSPLRASLAGLPAMIVHTASQDTLRDDGLALVTKARAAGVDVLHESFDGFWHDPHLSAWQLGEPVSGATSRIASQLRDRLLTA